MQGMRVLFGSAREELGHLRKNAGREGPSSAVHTLTHPSLFAAATDQHVPTVSSLLFFFLFFFRRLATSAAAVFRRTYCSLARLHW